MTEARFLHNEHSPFPPNQHLENPTFTLPPGLEIANPEYVVPDEVIDAAIERWHIAKPGMRIIDPFCGIARFIDRINLHPGAAADGIELDKDYHTIASTYATRGSIELETNVHEFARTNQIRYGGQVAVSQVILGDTAQTVPPLGYYGYHGVYTSPPFALLEQPRIIHPLLLAVGAMPKKGGFIVIDSAEEAIRNGESINPAAQTVALMFDAGYSLRDQLSFTTPRRTGYDHNFTELYFRRLGE